MTVPTIDVHAHILLPAAEALVAGLPGLAEAKALDARRNGTASLAVNGPMVAERIPGLTDVTVRLAAMDAQGVDIQLVSPSPAHYHYWADEDTAGRLCRLVNEATAAHCSRAPERLYGLGLVPLQHPEHAVCALTPSNRVCRVSRSPATHPDGSCRTRCTNPSGPWRRRGARSSSCPPSIARSASGWTGGTCPTRSASPPRTPSPSPT